MAKNIAEERIPARMPAAVYEKVLEAAQAVGATLNQFLVQSALEKANAILEQERVVRLSTAAAKKVFDLIDNPPEPNEKLKTAMQRRKDLSCR
ncbi:type II toxin-antitoxin system TacA family antitoxin [Geotalea toluenoxydans]|uniref:type II toxin-antitoxin system TacA family antitoxin n=1 Tax=Geotalea toluenoxydans TaxID=421624 RepID=UPI0006D1E053|nr:DUF1778 domain-containing protein [Geotalea toluenoxydans]